jgi:hypothetical protein
MSLEGCRQLVRHVREDGGLRGDVRNCVQRFKIAEVLDHFLVVQHITTSCILLVRIHLIDVHHANEPKLKGMPVNGGYGGVVVYAMRHLLHLLRGPHQCRFRQSLHKNILTKKFSP